MPLRYSICSEIFQGWDLRKICRTVKPMGYDGLEIAHFHLFETVENVSAAGRAEMRRIIEGEGMACSGLHWLLVSPKGFHITTRDEELRRRSWAYLDKLIDFCGDLGGPVMVLGSPFQRNATGEMTIDECRQRLVEGLAALAPHAADRNVTLLMEAVPLPETNVVNTLAEAAAIVRAVDHPAVKTMFDTHNTANETEPMIALLREYYPLVRHVHVNEMDGRHPGTGRIDFGPILRFLNEQAYTGWVSLEVFDFKPGGEAIAREAIEHLQSAERSVAAARPA